jgi:hypothetical protein
VVRYEIAEGAAGKRPGGDDTLVIPPVDHFPRLGEILTCRKVTTEERREAATTPQVAAIDRGEEQRGQHGGGALLDLETWILGQGAARSRHDQEWA